MRPYNILFLFTVVVQYQYTTRETRSSNNPVNVTIYDEEQEQS